MQIQHSLCRFGCCCLITIFTSMWNMQQISWHRSQTLLQWVQVRCLHVLHVPSIWSLVTMDRQTTHCQSSFIFFTHDVLKALWAQQLLVKYLQTSAALVQFALAALSKAGSLADCVSAGQHYRFEFLFHHWFSRSTKAPHLSHMGKFSQKCMSHSSPTPLYSLHLVHRPLILNPDNSVLSIKNRLWQ